MITQAVFSAADNIAEGAAAIQIDQEGIHKTMPKTRVTMQGAGTIDVAYLADVTVVQAAWWHAGDEIAVIDDTPVAST